MGPIGTPTAGSVPGLGSGPVDCAVKLRRRGQPAGGASCSPSGCIVSKADDRDFTQARSLTRMQWGRNRDNELSDVYCK